jgi:dTDP-4-dehydrorhamnose reductase
MVKLKHLVKVVLFNQVVKIILGTSWLYGSYGSNIVFTMLRLMNQRDSIGVIADQFGTPT